MTSRTDIGSMWGHRGGISGPLTPVTVVAVGSKKPRKIFVRFEEFKYEGQHKWVLRSQLRTPWSNAEAFLARERQWEAVESLSPEQSTAEFEAAHEIYGLFLSEEEGVPVDAFFMFWRDAHATTREPDFLADRLDWQRDYLLGHPATFLIDEGTPRAQWVLPWPTVRRMVVRTLWQNHDRTLAWLRDQDRQVEGFLAQGRILGSGRGRTIMDPAGARDFDETYERPARETIRRWANARGQGRARPRHRLSSPL